MSIPLIQDNQKDSINASLIAIKREEERLQALIAEADKKIAQLNELKVNKSDIVDEVTLNNMQSVTSNAVASALEWEDVGSSVTLTKSTVSGYFTNYTITEKTCFMTKNMVKLHFNCEFSSSLPSGFNSLKIHVTSSKFTMKRDLGRVSATSFHRDTTIGILTNEYSGETNAITMRIPSGSTIASGSNVTVSVMFPI
jgi:hypothetical protein